MTTKSLLKKFVWLRDELATKGPSAQLLVVRRGLNEILRSYRLQHRYEKAKTKYKVSIEFLESDTPVTDKDIANLKAAAAVNRQITGVLRDWHGRRAREVTP